MLKKSLVIDILDYLVCPSKFQGSKNETSSFLVKIWLLLRVYALSIFFVFIAGIILYLVTSLLNVNINDSDHAVADLLQNSPMLITIYLGVISAPLFEEIAFRLIIKTDNKKILALGLGGFSWFMFLFFNQLIQELTNFDQDIMFKLFDGLYENLFLPLSNLPFINSDFAFILSYFLVGLLGVLALTGFFYLILNFIPQKQITTFSQKRAGWILYTTSLLFAFIHITNYEIRFWYLFIVLTLPQFVISLFLAFLRVRIGFIWAVVMHAVHNGILLIPITVILNFYPDFLDNIEQLQNSGNSTEFNLSQMIEMFSFGEIVAMYSLSFYFLGLLILIFGINVYNLVEHILYKTKLKKQREGG